MQEKMNRLEYIEEFKKLSKSKLSITQTKSLFLGLIFKLVLDKEILDKNKIYEFTKEIIKKEYKEYLFRGRPYLASRILKDLEMETEYNDLLKITKSIIEYLHRDEDTLSKDSSKGNKNNVIGWYNSVNE